MSAIPSRPDAGPPSRPAGPTVAVSSLRHPLTRALLLLTVTTGLVDAATYLGLGHVFSANMTGNIVLLGFGLAGAKGLPVVAPLVSLGAFLLGAGAGGRLASKLAPQHSIHIGTALGTEVVLTAAAAVLAAVAKPDPSTVAADAVVGLLALAMGVRNATVRKLAVPDLTTTVLTLTLTGLAADSRPAGGAAHNSRRRSAAVAAILIGALVGALLEKQSLVLPLAVGAGTVGATLVGFATASR
jgi:uncharacterized membrane protein YoaK (UPF0700 family)